MRSDFATHETCLVIVDMSHLGPKSDMPPKRVYDLIAAKHDIYLNKG